MPQPPKFIMGGHRANPPPVPPKPKTLIMHIAVGKIKSIDDLSGGGGMNPLWLVSMKGTPVQLVVKAELQQNPEDGKFAKKNIKVMSEVMTTVSTTAASMQLDDSELIALDNFLTRPDSMRQSIVEARRGEKILTKMKFDPSFYSSSAHHPTSSMGSAIMTADEKAKAILLFNGLRENTHAWQTLGQVIIADALIGNGDRVNLATHKVMNFGNLIFSRDKQGNITHALGYDNFDPFADKAKLMYGQAIHVGSQPEGREAFAYDSWIGGFGQFIVDKSTFPQIAVDIIANVNSQRMVPLGLAGFGLDEERALGEGMVIGWDKLANSIAIKVREGKGIASGLMARAKYLGWVR